jgi:hypothetical protein
MNLRRAFRKAYWASRMWWIACRAPYGRSYPLSPKYPFTLMMAFDFERLEGLPLDTRIEVTAANFGQWVAEHRRTSEEFNASEWFRVLHQYITDRWGAGVPVPCQAGFRAYDIWTEGEDHIVIRGLPAAQQPKQYKPKDVPGQAVGTWGGCESRYVGRGAPTPRRARTFRINSTSPTGMCKASAMAIGVLPSSASPQMRSR